MRPIRLDKVNLVVGDLAAGRAVVGDPHGNGVGIMSLPDPALRTTPPVRS